MYDVHKFVQYIHYNMFPMKYDPMINDYNDVICILYINHNSGYVPRRRTSQFEKLIELDGIIADLIDDFSDRYQYHDEKQNLLTAHLKNLIGIKHYKMCLEALMQSKFENI